jgi:hypothetical protein
VEHEILQIWVHFCKKNATILIMQSIEDKVLRRIYGNGRGWVFTPAHFLDLGGTAAVNMALQSLRERGTIRRLARGLYDYPARHPQLGMLDPTPEQIARTLAGRDKTRIQPSGAYAANLLGLSLQVPAKLEFLTDGRNRTVVVGNQTITLRRTTPKNMATAGRISGVVIQALKHIGRKSVDEAVVAQLDRKLTSNDRKVLMQDVKLAPAWIADVFRELAKKDD